MQKCDLNKIIEQYDIGLEGDPRIQYAAAACGSITSPPILFSKAAFPELLKLKGDSGAKQISQQLAGTTIECRERILFYNVDCTAQYDVLLPLATGSRLQTEEC